jgi:Transcription factor WhiB
MRGQMSSPDWMLFGMCIGQPTRWWFPERGDKGDDVFNFKVAKRICSTCPVKKKCFDYGTETNSVGVWGGVAMRGRFQRNEAYTNMDLQNV